MDILEKLPMLTNALQSCFKTLQKANELIRHTIKAIKGLKVKCKTLNGIPQKQQQKKNTLFQEINLLSLQLII
jgi:hypothetical protein